MTVTAPLEGEGHTLSGEIDAYHSILSGSASPVEQGTIVHKHQDML